MTPTLLSSGEVASGNAAGLMVNCHIPHHAIDGVFEMHLG